MSKDKEKNDYVSRELVDFFDLWGKDEHAKIFLEILFKGLMNEETLFISGKQEQKGNKSNNNNIE